MNIRKLIRKTLEENYIQIQKQKHIENIVDFINDDDYSNLRDKLIGLGDEDFVEWVEQKDWPIHLCATVEICKRARISKFKDRLVDLGEPDFD